MIKQLAEKIMSLNLALQGQGMDPIKKISVTGHTFRALLHAEDRTNLFRDWDVTNKRNVLSICGVEIVGE